MKQIVEHVKCQECGFWFRGYVPKGGDGSVLFVRTHKTMDYSTRNGKTLVVSWPMGAKEPVEVWA